MKNIKNPSKTVLFSALILTGFFILAIFLLKTGSLKEQAELLPASVGRVLDPSRDHILIKFRPRADLEWGDKVFAAYGLKEEREIKGIGVKVVSIPANGNPLKIVEALNKNEMSVIEFAEPDYVVEPSLTPNDPWFANWQKDKMQINLPVAWDSTTGTEGMILAIADTGVNCTHEDLSSGCMAGWNFYDNNNDTTDVYGHGTAVAGVAAALGNNNIGVAGNAWQSKIMPLRVSAPDGTATYSAIASAITYAADGGAKVVNVSYQVGGSSTVQSAAKYLKGKGGLLVVSEGNYASDTGNTNSPDIISVSAVDASDVLYSWSSFGSDVDVSAPGCTGATTKADGGYGSFCGTSNSAPEVSGLLMLIWSVNPALTPDQVQNVLFNSTKDLGSVGWDKYYGWGRIDAEVAISMAVSNINPNPNPEPNPLPPPTIDTIPPVVDVTSPVDGSSVSGTKTVSASATEETSRIVKMEVYVDELLVLKINSKSSISYKWNTRKSSSGAHVINVKAYDETGNVGQSSVTVYK